MEELCAKLLIESHSRASGQRASHTSAHQTPPMWRAPEGSTAVPVGGGGARPGFRATRQPHVSTPGTTGVEGARGICRGAGGRWRGLAGLRNEAQAHVSTLGPTGAEGAGGTGGHGRASRSTTPSRRLACGDLAGGRALRRPEHPWDHKQPGPPAQHNETRPRPVARPRPRHAHAAPFTTAPPAIRRSCPRGPRLRRGQPRGGQRGRGTGSRTRSRHPRCGRSGSTAGRHRAHHTRRA